MRERAEIVNCPMTFGFDPRRISKTMMGTAATALSTADQTRALMGLTCNTLAKAPKSVAHENTSRTMEIGISAHAPAPRPSKTRAARSQQKFLASMQASPPMENAMSPAIRTGLRPTRSDTIPAKRGDAQKPARNKVSVKGPRPAAPGRAASMVGRAGNPVSMEPRWY
jgi:hypothetical protein